MDAVVLVAQVAVGGSMFFNEQEFVKRQVWIGKENSTSKLGDLLKVSEPFCNRRKRRTRRIERIELTDKRRGGLRVELFQPL